MGEREPSGDGHAPAAGRTADTQEDSMDRPGIQSALRAAHIDAWLVYDFRGSNQLLARLLPAPPGTKRFLTRRVLLLIPAQGDARLLANVLDASAFEREDHPGVRLEKYTSWREFKAWLESALEGLGRVAMEYAPGGALPVVSMVDAGTIELVRSMGVEVVSSADVMQATAAAWSDDGLRAHEAASKKTGKIVLEAFAFIRERLGGAGGRGGGADAGKVFEHDVAGFIRRRFADEGLEFPDGPIVAVNGHAADPHYEPHEGRPTEIRRGDWVLIDLWARVREASGSSDGNIYSDITWTGFAGDGKGTKPSARQQEVFDVVRRARDASVERAVRAWKRGERVQGWQLDEAAREVIIQAGFARGIRHRTGHSLSPGPLVHGLGMNLDNLETHDTRVMLPALGFTVEPGIYLPEENFGVRNEINVYVDPKTGPRVTSVSQEEIVMCG